MRDRIQNLLAFLLIAGGAFLLFWGAREYLSSRTGQWEAAREFRNSVTALPAAPAPERVFRPKAGETFARLMIPRLDKQLFIVEGDDAAELRRGPGHLIGTAMPGSSGNCVIAGHRDTHFRMLKDIHEGDDIVLETPAGEYLYRVKKTRVISAKDVEVLEPTSGRELSLITCYPFYYVGSAPKRFLVRAELAGAVRRTS